MSLKVRVRRHSFCSLGEAVKDADKVPQVTPCSGKKRKNLGEPTEVDLTPPVKKVATPASLLNLMESMREMSKDDCKRKTSNDVLCCLPGGR